MLLLGKRFFRSKRALLTLVVLVAAFIFLSNIYSPIHSDGGRRLDSYSGTQLKEERGRILETMPKIEDERDEKAGGIWANPLEPNSCPTTWSRFEFASKTHPHPTLQPLETRISFPKSCAGEKPAHCLGTALVVDYADLPSCLTNHLAIRSTYYHDGYMVMIIEISKALLAQRNKTLLCSDGNPAQISLFGLNKWINQAHKSLSHNSGFLKCPMQNPTDSNGQGLIVVNTGGKCNFDASGSEFSSDNDRKPQHDTDTYLIRASYYSSFMQAFKNEPRRASLYPVDSAHQHVPYQFSTCVMGGVIDTNAPFLTTWLWHLKNRVGIEHVTLYIAPERFDFNSPFINATFIKELVNTGYLHLVPWPTIYRDDQIFYKSQIAAYNDYIYRFRGMCHWTMFGDADDFFVSWDTNHSIIPVINHMMSKNATETNVKFAWPIFLPECQGITGLKGPYESDSLLPSLKYGYLNSRQTKHVDQTVDRTEAGIHSAGPRWFGSHAALPGVAVYHVRAGSLAKKGIDDLTPDICAKYELPQDVLNNRTKQVFTFW